MVFSLFSRRAASSCNVERLTPLHVPHKPDDTLTAIAGALASVGGSPYVAELLTDERSWAARVSSEGAEQSSFLRFYSDTEFPPTSSNREVAKMTSHEREMGVGSSLLRLGGLGSSRLCSGYGESRQNQQRSPPVLGRCRTLRSCTDGAIPPGFQKEFEVFAESIGGASQRMARRSAQVRNVEASVLLHPVP